MELTRRGLFGLISATVVKKAMPAARDRYRRTTHGWINVGPWTFDPRPTVFGRLSRKVPIGAVVTMVKGRDG